MLCESLNDGTHAHNSRASKDSPPASELVVHDWNQGKRQNSAERVRSRDDALEAAIQCAGFVTKVLTILSVCVMYSSLFAAAHIVSSMAQSAAH